MSFTIKANLSEDLAEYKFFIFIVSKALGGISSRSRMPPTDAELRYFRAPCNIKYFSEANEGRRGERQANGRLSSSASLISR